MNTANKKVLAAIMAKLDTIKAELDETLIGQVDDIQSEEQDKFDNMSERSQESERGEAQEALATALETFRDQLQEISDAIENAGCTYSDEINIQE